MITKKAKKGFAADDDPDRDILIVVARTNGLRVYHERLVVNDSIITAARSKPLIFETPSRLSAVTVSPNGNDIACGFWEGEMSILNNAFPAVVDYFAKLERGEQVRHPSQTILVRKMHWHAHPVATLSYQQTDSSDPLLYSAGEESVLIVWQLARGTSKPADTLPRLAKGGVAHILAAGRAQLRVFWFSAKTTPCNSSSLTISTQCGNCKVSLLYAEHDDTQRRQFASHVRFVWGHWVSKLVQSSIALC